MGTGEGIMFKMIRDWWKPKYPGKDWVSEANEEAYNTPDLCELESMKLQLLFLPCELQTSHKESEITREGAIRLFSAFSLNNFMLYRNRDSHRAVLLEGGRNRVKGEVWAVNPGHFSVLDNYKHNGVQCTRSRTALLVPYSMETKTDVATEIRSKICKLNAWIYEGIPDFWCSVLDGGYTYPPVSLYKPHNPFLRNYYYYNAIERTK